MAFLHEDKEKFRFVIGSVSAKMRLDENLIEKDGMNVTWLLTEIISKEVFREDYEYLTMRLLRENISYDTAITALKGLVESGMFDST